MSVALFGMLLSAGISVSSCSNDENLNAVENRAAGAITVQGVLTGTHNWSGTVYLDGKVFMKDGVLNIAAGTKIIGMEKTGEGKASALIITKTATINATGSANAPIVFTSAGDGKIWGGLVVLGAGAINQSEAQLIEGIQTSGLPAGVTLDDLKYGTPAQGKSDAEIVAINNVSSGTLQYVRVEYAGQEIGDGNELNAFTFGAVGSATTLDHCQAYYGEDDGFEFFGGAVNGKYLVSTATDDDAFDFDFGYRGKIQFAVATLDPSLDYSKDPNGIECDNENPYVSTHTPYTHPVLSNLTIVGTQNGSAGSALKSCANFRRGTQFTLVNSILYGYPKGILKETDNSFTLKNNIVASIPAGNEFSVFTPDASNVAKTVADIKLVNAWGDYTTTDLMPEEDSPAATGASFSGLSGFDVVTYKGAIDPESGRSTWLSEEWVK